MHSLGLFGFTILLIVSYFIEGETVLSIRSINLNSWLLISYQAIVVSLGAHLLMFYLYKFYTVRTNLSFHILCFLFLG